jgi:hypothetical protein
MLAIVCLTSTEYELVKENLGIDVAECLSFCEYCQDDGDCHKQEKASDIIGHYYEQNSIGG